MRRPESKVIWRMDQKIVALITLSSILAISQYTNSLWIPAPTDLKVCNRTSSSLTIDWSPVNASVVGYRVRYRRNDTSPRVSVNSSCTLLNSSTLASNGTAGQQFCMKHSMNYTSIFVCNNKTTVCLKNLILYTFYWIEVTAFTNESFAKNGTRITNHTDEGIPSSPPVNVTAYVHNSTTIFVAWLPVPRENRNGRIIKYQLDMNNWGSHTLYKYVYVSEGEEDIAQNVTVYGLRKYTKYALRVSAKTSKGFSRASNDIKVTTAEDAPDEAPTNLTVIKVTADSIQISWQPVPQESLNGKLCGYEICWKEEKAEHYSCQQLAIKDPIACRAVINDHAPTGFILRNLTNFTLRSLTVYTNYSVKIAAHTGAEEGLGPHSQAYFMSGEGVPTYPPRNVTAYNTSAHEIRVKWTPPVQEKIHGELAGFDVTFMSCDNKSCIHHMMICGSKRAVNLSNLTVFTFYNITVAAFTKVGIGNASDMIQTRTDESTPAVPPENFTAESRSFDSINASWKPVPTIHQRGIIIGYKLNVVNSSTTVVHWLQRNVTSKVIKNLQMFVEYKLSVAALTRKGEGRWSAVRKLKTKNRAPSVIPTNVTATPIGPTSINLTWAIRGLERGFILQSFVVSYRALKNGTWRDAVKKRVPTNETSEIFQGQQVFTKEYEIIEGLDVFTKYEIQMAAYTANLTGNFSRPINVITKEGVPSPPVNVRTRSWSLSSVRVDWDEVQEDDRNGNITGYIVEWRIGSLLISNRTVDGENNRTAVLDDLEMFVTYNISVRAKTKAGPGQPSSPVNATTNQTIPDVNLTLFKAGATSNSSINVSWKIQHINKRLNEPTRYRLSYCPKKYCENYSFVENHNAETSADLENLITYVKYKIRVKAVGITAKDGTKVLIPSGNFSEPIYERTLEGVPGAAPSNVSATPESTTSILVRWGKLPWDKVNANITQYIIKLYNGSTLEHLQSYNVSSHEFSFPINGLEVYSNYSVQVQAVAKMGSGPFSEFVNITTHQPAPTVVPEIVKAVATGTTTIRVTWNHVETRGIVGFQGFKIKYTNAVLGEDFQNVDYVNSFTLTNLKIFAEYKIQVAARSTQPGNFSSPQTVRTLEGVPSKPPGKAEPEVLDSISVRLHWRSVPEGFHNGIIRGYRILYKRLAIGTNYQEKTTVPPATTLLLLNLDKATTYHGKVLAYTNAGDGKESNFTFKTADDIPSQPPVELKPVNRISPTKLNVTWKPVPEQFRHGSLTKYNVTYQRVKVGDVKTEEEEVKYIEVDASQTHVSLTNLEPYSEYKVSVAAATSKGKGPFAFAIGETCHCESTLTTSWRRYEPYANVSDDGQPGEIIPWVLKEMVDECCGSCSEFETTVVNFKRDASNKESAKNSSHFLLKSLDTSSDFTFPIYGSSLQDSYKGGFGYVPVIESSGVAFIVYPDSTQQNTMFNLVIRWSVLFLLPMVTAYAPAVIIWILERTGNANDFHPSFIRGTWEGIWWSFVTMTTLGYGDRAPLSYKGRLFSVVWMYFGLVIIAVTMAMLTAVLTTDTLKSATKIYGSKIAAEQNSPEYHLGMRRNAKYEPGKEYHSLEEVTEALLKRKVQGILVDARSAGLRNDLFSKFEVRKIVDYKTAYGIVLSPRSTSLRKCFHRYLQSHRAELFKMIKSKNRPIQTSNSTDKEEVASGVLFDSTSLRKALPGLSINLGVALFFSLMYEVRRRIRSREKVHQKVNFKEILQKEMNMLVEEFFQRMRKIKEALGEKHRRQIIRFWKLRRNASFEARWLRISQVTPIHSKEVTVTELT